MTLQQNSPEVGSEWPCSKPHSFYLRLGTLLADFLIGPAGFLVGVTLETLTDFFAAFDALDLSFFCADFDLLLCFTGVM